MTHVPGESARLPSPECMLPTPEEVTARVAGMHRRLFEAAHRPMLPPQQTLLSSSSTEWTVEVGGLTLLIDQEGQFGTAPILDSLRTDYFAVRMRAGQGQSQKGGYLDVFHREGGELAFSDDGRYSGDRQMSKSQMGLGIEALHSFLRGGVKANKRDTRRYITVLGEDSTLLSADETVTQAGDEPTQTVSTVEIKPNGYGMFSFGARMSVGEGVSAEYRDTRDYDGPFGIEVGQLACLPVDRGLIEILPPRLGSSGRLPERLERDQEIDQTRGVLTRGRLEEVQERVEAGLQQLAEYHGAYNYLTFSGGRYK